MKKKYKLKKKYSISIAIIIVAAIATVSAMNIGYSLFGSKLNIYGKVSLKAQSDKLEVDVPTVGDGRYVTVDESSNKFLNFVSDVYSENSLTTTFKKMNNSNANGTVGIRFSLVNNSNSGYPYTNGRIEEIEIYNPNTALGNISMTISPETIAYGEAATIRFSATINNKKITNDIYCKYAIKYEIGGVTKYFYYTMKILAA